MVSSTPVWARSEMASTRASPSSWCSKLLSSPDVWTSLFRVRLILPFSVTRVVSLNVFLNAKQDNHFHLLHHKSAPVKLGGKTGPFYVHLNLYQVKWQSHKVVWILAMKIPLINQFLQVKTFNNFMEKVLHIPSWKMGLSMMETKSQFQGHTALSASGLESSYQK